MRARRRLLILSLCVLLLLAVLAAVIVLRKRAAPEAARLLPEGDVVLYVDFADIRHLTGFNQPLPSLAPGYEEFVRQTGFAFERDLDEAAMAVHRGAANGQTRYTEILTGHYDAGKLANYLRQHARSMDEYRDVEVFSIPIEDRTLRVAPLSPDTVAVSNMDEPATIHGIIDRFKKVALPFGGPPLVRTYYRKVPLGSLLWAVAHLPAASAWPNAKPSFTLPGGIDVALPADSDVVVSLRMLRDLHARADFYTPSEQAAHTFTEQASTFLALFRGIQASVASGPSDPDVKAVIDSIQVAQKGNRAELTTTIPPAFLRKLVSQPASNTAQGAPAPAAPGKQ